MLRSARRPLVCLHYGIGDVIMQLPVLESLKSYIPDAAITLLGAQPALELFDDDRRWRSVQSVQAWGLRHWGDGGDSDIRAAVAAWVERSRFDIILDVSHAVHAVKEVLWQLHWNILDTGTYLPTYDMDGVQAIKHSVARKWELPVSVNLQPRIHLGQHRLQFADDYALRHLNGKPPIVISALASSALKRWPPGKLAQTAEALSSCFDLPVMIFAGPQARMASRVAHHLKRPPVNVGPLHLLDTAALLSRCALLICNDTGLMHMGAAVGTPVVAVFGPTDPSIYLPPTASCKAVGSTISCPHRKKGVFGPSACLVKGHCLIGTHSCIDDNAVASVLEAAMGLLNKSSKGVAWENA